jgi:nitroimidazol reductase NimA-like FMN-containing flavoprotein (pyridoxamine 5'-phosphate oxidase superfamily)
MTTIEMTDRTRVRRLADRGRYDAGTIYAILDEALICHVGFVVDSPGAPNGAAPVVIPTIHWREGDTLYFHGSAASRMLRSLKNGVEACVTVTLLDGLVLARSAFHHSMNYRSVVVFGTAREVTDEAEKIRTLDALVEHVMRGRSAEIRQPNARELRQTLVLALPLEEASAKIRTGGPVDDEEDYALPVWAGVLPLALTPREPVADGEVVSEVPRYVREYAR